MLKRKAHRKTIKTEQQVTCLQDVSLTFFPPGGLHSLVEMVVLKYIFELSLLFTAVF